MEGIFVVLASSLEVSLFRFSGGENEVESLFISEGLLLVHFELAGNSNFLDLTSGEGS